MKPRALDEKEISQRLDDYLDVEFSFLKTEHHARTLAGLATAEQAYLLHWVKCIASTNIQLAWQFIEQAVPLLDNMDRRIIEDWALHAMDIYDQSGLHAALAVIRNVHQFIETSHAHRIGASFSDHAGILLHFVHGLSGRKLELKQADECFTDTQTLFLPPLIAQLETPKDNFIFYKSLVVMLWAQVRFSSFPLALKQALEEHPQAERLLTLYQALEHLRLQACIARELPGLYRGMQAIQKQLEDEQGDHRWRELAQQLADKNKCAQDSLQLALDNLDSLPPPPASCFRILLKPEQVYSVMAQRMEKEKTLLRLALAKLENELNQNKSTPDKLEVRYKPASETDKHIPIEIRLDNQPVAPPDEIKALASSVVLDFGEIPDEHLVPAGPGDYDPAMFNEEEKDPDEVWKGTYHEEGASLYNEWDYRRQHYRKNWCAVREKTIEPVYDDFVDLTLKKYSGLIKHLRKTFEAMRDEDRLLKRQSDGDGIDIDALVEALADARDGSELSERLFTRMHRVERNIAVIFMVDMSGSTKGWINDAERESLILLCEALESLGDRYAIYGFSGMARKRCEIYRIKEFSENYNDEIKARISGIEAKDYTRMGFAIRHLTKILNEVDARTRILITLSDGKPDDYDNYRGDYGIEDTRRALIEARREGIHPYCITIDEQARDYLPHMYGPAAFTVIDQVDRLPLKVSDIYRRLTV